jgi:hypothetical protein
MQKIVLELRSRLVLRRKHADYETFKDKEVFLSIDFLDADNIERFYTDANGLDMVERVITSNQVDQLTPDSIYPMTSLVVATSELKLKQIMVLGDRS